MGDGKSKSKSKDSGSKQKKRRKTGLGKGLDALFPDIVVSQEESSGNLLECDVDKIVPNPYQPRRDFPENEMVELADSIKVQGILQPLLVRESSSDGYELIAGERRLRAAKMAGLFKVPVIIKNIGDTELLELSIVENIQRQNLNPMEEAEAYLRLLTDFKMTQEKVARQVGKSRSAVANFLRLNQLPNDIKSSIKDGLISMGHARALLGAETSALQRRAWKIVILRGLSVRATEALIQRLNSEKQRVKKSEKRPADVYFLNLEEDLARYFGTKVMIKRRGQKGKVEIEFYGNDDLDRLLGLLKSD
ncbi:MAG: ParB/RepB/Spo0J family partition protein [Desulfobacteraceae bacterium]|nr:ParB/RepB/Spo0J family partition protein [Desulfobacteraceae bacterium]MBC2755553.1 ParB/RepB/Spo0J family partition protein [Desulfobacteraceae bacterium]